MRDLHKNLATFHLGTRNVCSLCNLLHSRASSECIIFIVAPRVGETFRGLMTVCKVIPLEAIHDMNKLTFHGNTKVGPITGERLLERLDTENRNRRSCVRSISYNL